MRSQLCSPPDHLEQRGSPHLQPFAQTAFSTCGAFYSRLLQNDFPGHQLCRNFKKEDTTRPPPSLGKPLTPRFPLLSPIFVSTLATSSRETTTRSNAGCTPHTPKTASHISSVQFYGPVCAVPIPFCGWQPPSLLTQRLANQVNTD